MRIAYVYILVEPHIGIEKKLSAQAETLDRIDANELDLYAINSHREHTEGRIRYVRLPRNSSANWMDYVLFRFRLIEKAIDCAAYDYIIIRYPFADPSGERFCAKHNVITEHHTKEEDERIAVFRSSVSLPQKLHKLIYLYFEKRYGARILKKCKGIISVTNEIGRYELTRAGVTLPSTTIANGVEVEAIKNTGFVPFDGKELNLVFLAGSEYPWHGLDRVIDSLCRYRGSVQVTLHIVGNISSQKPPPELFHSTSIEYHERLEGTYLDALMGKMNLAISTMALHRKRMTEACSLKTREYTARGIPFVLAYEDPDLAMVEEERKFFLSFPNDDSPFSFDRIIDFARSITESGESISAYMREYAFQHMDWGSKMRAYVEFVRGLFS